MRKALLANLLMSMAVLALPLTLATPAVAQESDKTLGVNARQASGAKAEALGKHWALLIGVEEYEDPNISQL